MIADGLAVGQVIDGAPSLGDPQVACASHPYAHQKEEQDDHAVWGREVRHLLTACSGEHHGMGVRRLLL
ncbi:MAG: hypothetical protein ACRDSP_23075 [Pseudonocardiaceae bacterium]